MLLTECLLRNAKSFGLVVFFLLAYISVLSTADIMEIYNTRLATSDLLWTKHSAVSDEGWEEVSSFDRHHQNTIRSYQVCSSYDDYSTADTSSETSNNWIRSPYIAAVGGKRIYIDVEFSVAKCSSDIDGKKSTKCKETFNIFYYEADSAVASSTFPPWVENPYVKIDTVAANAVGGVNIKTFNFAPNRQGFYIAVQDQGACMSLISLRVYYFYCSEKINEIAYFPKTISDAGLTSLVRVNGYCPKNTEISPAGKPVLYCSSDGRWQIPTGSCQCKVGYHSNYNHTECRPCEAGTYKIKMDSNVCQPCPSHSGPVSSPTTTEVDKMVVLHNKCPCHAGYARTQGEDISVACTRPPSQLRGLKVTKSNATSANINWSKPADTGGRNDLFYSFRCQVARTSETVLEWHDCPATVSFIAPSRENRYYKTFALVSNLTPYMMYKFYVIAKNGASVALNEQSSKSRQLYVVLQTNESVPSTVNDVGVTNRQPTSVTIEWQPPSHANGIIIGYEVELKPTFQQIANVPLTKASLAPDVKKVKMPSITFDGLNMNAKYQVRVRAETSIGYGKYNQPSTFYTASQPLPGTSGSITSKGANNVFLIVGVVCGLLVISLLLFVGWRYKQTGRFCCLNSSHVNKKKDTRVPSGSSNSDPMLQQRLIVDLPPPNQRIYVDYRDPQIGIARLAREIEVRNIKVKEVIGQGEFAEVCCGKWTDNSFQADVAVKRLKPGATKKDQLNFLREASTMAQFNDPNIIQLQGVVTKSNPCMIITEYMENRSLDQYLKLQKGQLSIIQLVHMLRGIASGMRYLSSMKYVHRDLAARNILVNSDLVCKVSDFGLSRTLESDPNATYTTQGGKIAIRWTALECILYRKFTLASDVWSFGIVMWEVISWGEKPYWDMSNDDVIANLQQGMRLPSPPACPKPLHDTMVDCWAVEPSSRPLFVELVNRIDALLQQPDLLQPETTDPSTQSRQAACEIATPNLSSAICNGEIENVDQWLEMQKLSKYKTHFRQRGIDNLDKVSHLTINDLKAIGIDVTLHINKLENGIRTLKRHLSTVTSTPRSSIRTSNASAVFEEENEIDPAVEIN